MNDKANELKEKVRLKGYKAKCKVLEAVAKEQGVDISELHDLHDKFVLEEIRRINACYRLIESGFDEGESMMLMDNLERALVAIYEKEKNKSKGNKKVVKIEWEKKELDKGLKFPHFGCKFDNWD